MVDVGAFVNEELDHTLMSLPASKGERSIIVTARWNIDLGSRVQEKLRSFIVTLSVWRNKVIMPTDSTRSFVLSVTANPV